MVSINLLPTFARHPSLVCHSPLDNNFSKNGPVRGEHWRRIYAEDVKEGKGVCKPRSTLSSTRQETEGRAGNTLVAGVVLSLDLMTERPFWPTVSVLLVRLTAGCVRDDHDVGAAIRCGTTCVLGGIELFFEVSESDG